MKCKIFDICGGCDFSHESTAEQNEYKDDYIKNIFKDRFIPKEIISMENPYYYRNKSLRTYQRRVKTMFWLVFMLRNHIKSWKSRIV